MEQNEKILAEEIKRSEANCKNAQYQKDFLKLQQDCNVREISDLVKYQLEQKQQKADLNEQVRQIADEIEQKKAKLQALKE